MTNSVHDNAGEAGSLSPVPPTQRVFEIDVMRGWALLGVLLAYALWNLGSPPESTFSKVDLTLNTILSILIDTKAYSVFAFLFGLGFSIQLTRAASRGANIVRLYSRRLIALLLIGLIHALLLRNGDILVPYAVTGFLLLLFRNSSDRTLLIASIIALFYPPLARIVWELAGTFPQRPETAGMSYIAGNLAWVQYWYSIAIVYWPGSIPMFLFGLYIGRRRLFENLEMHIRAIKLALVIGLTVGMLAWMANFILLFGSSNLSMARRLFGSVVWTLHAWGLATFYCALLLLLLRRYFWRRLFGPVGAVGRMALTNYLLQGLIIVPICIGFDLFGKFTPTMALVIAGLVWAVQVPSSVWWLRYFRFGPAEWLWRSLTYGRPQPMRRLHEQAFGDESLFTLHTTSPKT